MERLLVSGLLERRSFLPRNIKSAVVVTSEEVTEVIIQLGKKQKWRTKSGKKSSETGERYLPSKAVIAALSSAEYAATTRAKRKGKAKGKQFVAQPKKIARKVKQYRS